MYELTDADVRLLREMRRFIDTFKITGDGVDSRVANGSMTVRIKWPRREFFLASAPGILACDLQTDGGGNATTSAGAWVPATYTYKGLITGSMTQIKDFTMKTPTWTRPQALLTGPATHGLYYVDSSGPVLLLTDEQLYVDPICTT